MQQDAACLIFGAGEYYAPPPSPHPDDYIIAADGGFAYLKQHDIIPHLLVGDFDSLGAPPIEQPHTIILPKEKDETDMAAAIREGWQHGLRTFHIFGGTGGRLDHTLANIQCLAALTQAGGRGYLWDRDTVITAIQNSSIFFTQSALGLVSIFCHSEQSTGVSLTGFKYPLTDATLTNSFALGISNELIALPSRIEVQQGTLVIVYPQAVQAHIQYP